MSESYQPYKSKVFSKNKSRLQKFFSTSGWRIVMSKFWLKLSPMISSDRLFIKWDYFWGMGKLPDLDNPKGYNEKLQWLKLNCKHPGYSRLVDKHLVKSWVAEKIGSEYVIPTIGVYDSWDDIDFDSLPQRFVIKTTHDSGGVVVCTDKSRLDKAKARAKIEKSLSNNYFYEHREYPYKAVVPKILIEEYVGDGGMLPDYKFFCFNGQAKMMFIATDRPVDTRFDFFDRDFRHLPFCQGHPNANRVLERPELYEKMVEIAEVLSEGFPHVRVDLYTTQGRVYFGEMTFFHFAANTPIDPAEWDKKIGDMIVLPDPANWTPPEL